jgi:hypothetical protein
MYDLTIGAVVAGKGIRRVVILQLRQLSQRSRSGSKIWLNSFDPRPGCLTGACGAKALLTGLA